MRVASLLAALSVSALSLSAFAVRPAAAQGDGAEARGFLEQALRGDNSEMALGRLAAQRAVDPAVRAFGRTLHDDHAHARDMTLPVAREVGADVTKQSTGEAMREEEKLEGTYGRAFDREFVRYMIADHRQDIADYQDAARRGGSAGRLAERLLPDLKKHLDMAERLSEHG